MHYYTIIHILLLWLYTYTYTYIILYIMNLHDAPLIQKISKSTKMAIITYNIDKRYFIVVIPRGGVHANFHGKQWKGLAKSHVFIGHTFSTVHACFSEIIRSSCRYKGHPLFLDAPLVHAHRVYVLWSYCTLYLSFDIMAPASLKSSILADTMTHTNFIQFCYNEYM